MKRFWIPAFAGMTILLLSPVASTSASSLKLNSQFLRQGDTLIISLPLAREVAVSTFAGQKVNFFEFGDGQRAIVGIPPDLKPGNYRLRFTFKDGSIAWRTIRVRARNFPVIDLGVPENIDRTPDQVVQNFADLNTELKKIMAAPAAAPLFQNKFQLPLQSFTRYGSPFGELRKTGSYTVRHLGTDFTAPLGTPVMAIGGGVVRLATVTGLYGNTVVLDHGAGIYSLYLHLNEIKVKADERVEKGQVVGTLGQTGYAFGPHLHLSLKINGISVDPERFISTVDGYLK